MRTLGFAVAVTVACAVAAHAQSPAQTTPTASAPTAQPAAPVSAAGQPASNQASTTRSAAASSVALPNGYVIGPEDVLGILFWREPDMSGDLAVRPDGLISLPLIGDVRAAGLTPDALRSSIEDAAGKYITEPKVTILVKQINSRKVFITGQVANPGAYPLIAPRTVMQLIAIAGGLKEYADSKNITVMRFENGKQQSYKFDYETVAHGKALPQNIQLQPGDTVVVP